MNIFHLFGFSSISYLCPIKPRTGEVPRFWKDSPAHTGNYRYAKDIIIPDPRDNPLDVYAPASGVIIELKQSYTNWGDSPEYYPYLNYVTVAITGSSEFYQLCHILKDSCTQKIGQTVAKGEKIAITGVNGYMTDVRHLHILVARYTTKGFLSLRIRWDKAPGYI